MQAHKEEWGRARGDRLIRGRSKHIRGRGKGQSHK